MLIIRQVIVDLLDAGILEDGNVQPGRIFGLTVEPKKGRNILHGTFLSWNLVGIIS
jgi:hypothetical protein